jgi:hypothetical protein
MVEMKKGLEKWWVPGHLTWSLKAVDDDNAECQKDCERTAWPENSWVSDLVYVTAVDGHGAECQKNC